MTPELARRLVPLVNDKNVMEALLAYAEYRVQQARLNNDTAPDFGVVRQNQGKVTELERFKTLRDEVYKAIDMDPRRPITMTIVGDKKKA